MSAHAQPLAPSYGGLACQLQTPMQHGDGRRLLTNPALLGLADPPQLIGRVVCLHELFFVAGPGCCLSDEQLRQAALRRCVEQADRHLSAPARRLYRCRSQADALATLWELVAAHYGIPTAEAAAQVVRQQQRDAAEAGWDTACPANGAEPHGYDLADWIPDYPPP